MMRALNVEPASEPGSWNERDSKPCAGNLIQLPSSISPLAGTQFAVWQLGHGIGA